MVDRVNTSVIRTDVCFTAVSLCEAGLRGE